MSPAFTVLSLLPWADWLVLACFFIAWAGYAHFARRRAERKPSILATTNLIRRKWMLQSTFREVRLIDSVVMQSLSSSASFFASTTILILGGLLAVLGAGDKASDLVQEIPFAARTTALVFDLKLLLLAGIFVYAFFRFTWSMRQYSFAAMLVATTPELRQFNAMDEAEAQTLREGFGDRAGRVAGLAAETFNDGLRAYYMSFAAIGWFFSPLVFAAATAGVLWILYRREFHSDVLALLRSASAMPPER
ncbi:DUF599 domain-containing protein [Piscinibacter sp. Jin2]|uniref:DUF599 domain-containing protein n=1 Tax=Aquariibacter lacus TaxID=2801332 RepID=A0A9X0XFY2_9BURK|nr:DUF599 domain-containing protein [Piscinibacter lacus]MBL0720368.1 DUF599 domain-containing protein [Piscinibacter lacus]